MSTRRSKRSNKASEEDPETEPAAKRTATEQNGVVVDPNREAIQRAQAALDRLDFKTGIEICNQILENTPSDPTQSLLLRSNGLERSGRIYDAVKDAETALEGQNTRQTRLRAAFAHLSVVLHHLESAQELPSQVEEQPEPFLTEEQLGELKDELKTSKARELKSPFKRLSPELFIRAISFCEAQTKAMASATCKSWRKSILEATDLFREFKMEGTVLRISQGITVFGSRSSIKSIDIRCQDCPSEEQKDLLLESVRPSFTNLQALSICHQGDMCDLVVQLACECENLSVFVTSKMEDGEGYITAENSLLELPETWNPKLSKFIWNVGPTLAALECNDHLLAILQDASEITIASVWIEPEWVVRLLSSASNLKELHLPFIEKNEAPIEIPSVLTLPWLKRLSLGRVPSGGSNDFYKSLKAVSLKELGLGEVDPKGLASLNKDTTPQHLAVKSLVQIDGKAHDEETAESFIEAIKSWQHLSKLENIDADHDRSLLPLLQHIRLDVKDHSDTDTIDGKALAGLAASRLARSRGLSDAQVSLAANGRLEVCLEASQTTEATTEERFASLTNLIVEGTVKIDLCTYDWLERNVKVVQFRDDIIT